jgi:hypothetical protein
MALMSMSMPTNYVSTGFYVKIHAMATNQRVKSQTLDAVTGENRITHSFVLTETASKSCQVER